MGTTNWQYLRCFTISTGDIYLQFPYCPVPANRCLPPAGYLLLHIGEWTLSFNLVSESVLSVCSFPVLYSTQLLSVCSLCIDFLLAAGAINLQGVRCLYSQMGGQHLKFIRYRVLANGCYKLQVRHSVLTTGFIDSQPLNSRIFSDACYYPVDLLVPCTSKRVLPIC